MTIDLKKRSTLIRRMIASCTLIAFAVTSHFQNPVPAFAAAPVSENRVLPPELRSVKLPVSLGKIEDIYQGVSGKTVIVIQDAHAIPDAQKNIFRILRYFQKRYGVKLTGVEGANAALDPQIFKSFPDKKILKQTFGNYFNQGELTGSTASAVFTDGAEYRGVEDWALYEKGLGLYLAALEQEPALNEKLNAWEKDLEARKETAYGAELKAIDRQWRAFEENQSNLLEAIRALAGIQKPVEGSEVAAVLAESAEKSPEEITAEVKALAGQVKTDLKEDTAVFNQKYQLFETSQITPQAFALFIKQVSHKHHIPVKVSPVLLGGMKNQKTLQQLEGTKFFSELEKYAQSVKKSLMNSEEQKALDRESRVLFLAKKLTRLELSRKEWNEIVEADLTFEKAGEFQIQKAFYENAEQRDAAFLENLERISVNKNALMVAGGFHAQGLTQRLKEKKISYVLVMPQIREIPKKTNYRAHMKGEVSWKKYFREEEGKINLYQAFVRGTRDRLLSASPADSKRTTLKSWRDQIIRDLAEQKRIEKAGDYTRFLDEAVSGNSQSELTGKISAGFQKVNQFLSGLKKLESQNQITDQNIANLLRVGGAAEEATASALVSVQATSFSQLASRVLLEMQSGPEAGRRSKQPAVVRREIRSANEFSDETSVRAKIRSQGPSHAGIRTSDFSNYTADRTPVLYAENDSEEARNRFVEKESRTSQKSLDETRRDLDDAVGRYHEKMKREYGFLEPSFSPEVQKIFEVFEKLKIGYDKLASSQGRPLFRGKLFVVDSPSVNAFVFAEHDDVYIHMGLIREMAHDALLSGKEFSEEKIAAVLGHEMTHILQKSSYEGLSISKQKQRNVDDSAILSLRRRAEYDADRGSIVMMTLAGYSPRPVLEMLEFLVRITPGSTAEDVVSDHPHAKERLARLNLQLGAPHLAKHLVTSTWTQKTNPLDAETYFNLRTRHIYDRVPSLNSYEKFEQAAAEISTAKELFELARLADERARLTRLKSWADSGKARLDFAHDVFRHNILDAAQRIFEEVQNQPPGENSLSISPVGAYIEEEISAQEQGSWGISKLDDRELQDLELNLEKDEKKFTDSMKNILHSINGSVNLTTELKRKAAQAVLALLSYYRKTLPLIEEDSFAKNLDRDLKEVPDLETLTASLREGKTGDEILSHFSSVPFSVYANYGRASLDRTVQKRLPGDASLYETSEEIEDSGFYRRSIHFQQTATPQERGRAYDAARYSWAHERYKSPARANAFRKKIAALVREKAPTLPPSLEGKGDAEHAKDLLALLYDHPGVFAHFSSPINKQDRDFLIEYISSFLVPEAGKLHSELYQRENGLPDLGPGIPAGQYFERQQNPYYELIGDHGAAALFLYEALQRAKTPEEIPQILKDQLSIYSNDFKILIFREIFQNHNMNVGKQSIAFARPSLWFEGLQGVFANEHSDGFADAYSLMTSFLQIDIFDYLRIPRKTKDSPEAVESYMKDYLEFTETVFLKKRAVKSEMLSKSIAANYLKARTELLVLKDEEPDPETVFKDLELLSKHAFIRFDHWEQVQVDKKNETPHAPILGEWNESQLPKESRELEENEYPIGFFNAPAHVFEQQYVLQFLKFDLAKLQQIAANQKRLLSEAADSNQRNIGRVQFREKSDNNFLHLLNAMIIKQAAREAVRPGMPEVSALIDKFSKAYSVSIGLSASKKFSVSFSLSMPYIRRASEVAGIAIAAEKQGDPDYMRRFLAILEQGFVVNSSSVAVEQETLQINEDDTNAFFFNLTSRGARFTDEFPKIAPFMVEPIASLVPPKKHSRPKPESYLRVFTRHVAIEGPKVQVFKGYARKNNLLAPEGTPEEMVARIQAGLSNAGFFRDAIFELWERTRFLPEMHRHSLITKETMQKFMNLEPKANLNQFIWESRVEIPLQWRELEKQELSLGERADEALRFYAATIPLLMDVQRQLRFGATAFKIWRNQNPKASFQEEKAQILRFFPQPSEVRDEILDNLFENHELPSEEVSLTEIEATRQLYSVYQKMEYDEELTHFDALTQGIQSLGSAATRKDRRDTLLWILNKKKYPMPAPFLKARTESNILFDDLPDHLRYAPEAVKRELLTTLLTGENGLMNARTEQDAVKKRETAEAVFDHFFPASDNHPEESGLSPEGFDLLRQLFIEIMVESEQTRAAALMLELLSMERKLSEMSLEQRLATLMVAMGPAAVKGGQFSNLKIFASLKSNAKPVSKIAVLNTLLASGFDLNRLRVGDVLGAASMKQVHAGEYLNDEGRWVPVVVKVLRPALARTVPEDLRVLERVLLKPEILNRIQKIIPGFKAGDAVKTIRSMIDQESDLNLEAENEEKLRLSIEAYYQSHPARKGMRVNVPRVIAASQEAMIEEMVDGVKMDWLVRSEDRKQAREKLLLQLEKRGVPEAIAQQIAGLGESGFKSILRKVFLHNMLVPVKDEKTGESRSYFHADPHGGNIMVTPNGPAFIDTGLLGSFNEAQIADAKKIIKAVLMRDAQRAFEAIRNFLQTENGVLDDEAETRREIGKIFETRAADIDKLLHELGAVIVKQGRGAGSETFGRFIKAFTQGLWMFPVNLATLWDVARATGMNPLEFLTAVFRTGIPNQIGPLTFRNIFTKIRQGFRSMSRRYQAEMKEREIFHAVHEEVSGVGAPAEAEPLPAEIAPEEISAPVSRRTLQENKVSQPHGDGPLVKTAAIENKLAETVSVKMNAEALQDFREKNPGISEETVHQAMGIYGEFVSVFERVTHGWVKFGEKKDNFGNFTNGYGLFGGAPVLSLQEYHSVASILRADGMTERYVNPDTYQDMNESITLSKRLLAAYFTREYLRNGNIPGAEELDFFGLSNPRIRYAAENLASLYLTSLEGLDFLEPLQDESGNPIARTQMIRDRFKNNPEWTPRVQDSLGSGAEPIYLTPQLLEDASPAGVQTLDSPEFPDFAASPDIRSLLQKVDLTQPHMVTMTTDKKGTAVTVGRKQHIGLDPAEKTIDLDVHKDGTVVKMKFSDSGYEEFLKSGAVQDFEVQHYSSQLRAEIRTAEKTEGNGTLGKSGWLAEELGLSQKVLQEKLESPEIKWNMAKLNAALRGEFPGRVPYIKQIHGSVGMAFAIGFENLYRLKIEESVDNSFGFVGLAAEKVGVTEIALPGVYSQLTQQQDGVGKTLEDIPLNPGRLLPLIAERIKNFKITGKQKQQTSGRPDWVYTLSQALEKSTASGTEKAALVRAHILEWLRTSDTEKQTWPLPLLRQQFMELFPELDVSKFEYGLLLWELNLQDEFQEEYESRADRFAGSLAGVGASFGINTNGTRTMKVIQEKLAGFRKRGKEVDEESVRVRRAGQVDLNQIRILEALSKEKGERVQPEDILAELNAPDLDWNLPEFFERHPSMGWLKSRGYEVFLKGAGLEADARKKMRERYEYYNGVMVAASESFGLGNQVGRDFYEAMGLPPKLLFVRRGNLLKTFGVTKDEMLDRMTRSQWKDLFQLRDELVSKFNAAQKERQKPELPRDKNKLGNVDILWGLDLANEFFAELKKRQDEGRLSYEIARSFGFEGSKASATSNFSGVVRRLKTRVKKEKSLPVLFDGQDLQIILGRFAAKYPYGNVQVLRQDNVWQTLRSPFSYSGTDQFVTSTRSIVRQLIPFPYQWAMTEDRLKIEPLKSEAENPGEPADSAAAQSAEKTNWGFSGERSELRTIRPLQREDIPVLLANDNKVSAVMLFKENPSEPVYDISNPELLKTEADLFKQRNWRLSGKTQEEIEILLRDRLQNFRPDFKERIKDILLKQVFDGNFNVSDIASIASFGSFWYEENPDTKAISDLDIIVVLKRPGIQIVDKKIEISPDEIFKPDAKRKPDTIQFLVFSEDYFLDRLKLDEDFPEGVFRHSNFETMTHGGGIILEGRDYWKDAPPVYSLVQSAEQLILGAFLYLATYRHRPRMGPLVKIKRRLEEASRILSRVTGSVTDPQLSAEAGPVFFAGIREKIADSYERMRSQNLSLDDFISEMDEIHRQLKEFTKSQLLKDLIEKDLQARLEAGQTILTDLPLRSEIRTAQADWEKEILDALAKGDVRKARNLYTNHREDLDAEQKRYLQMVMARPVNTEQKKFQEAYKKWNSRYLDPVNGRKHLALQWRDANLASGVGSIFEFYFLKAVLLLMKKNEALPANLRAKIPDLSEKAWIESLGEFEKILDTLGDKGFGLLQESEKPALIKAYRDLDAKGQIFQQDKVLHADIFSANPSEAAVKDYEAYYEHAALAFQTVNLVVPALYHRADPGRIRQTVSLDEFFETRKEKAFHFSLEQGFSEEERVVVDLKSSIKDKKQFLKDHPELIFKAFSYAASLQTELSGELRLLLWNNRKDFLRWVQEQRESNAAALEPLHRDFLNFLGSSHPVSNLLWEMHRLEILEGYLPEYQGIHNLISNFNVHQFTVDQHSLYNLQMLDTLAGEGDKIFALEEGNAVLKNLLSEQEGNTLLTLRLALLFHDSGKRDSRFPTDADHALVAAQQIVPQRLKEMGIPEDQIAQVVWLVRNHMMLNEYVRKRPENYAQSLPFMITNLLADPSITESLFEMLYLVSLTDRFSVMPWSDTSQADLNKEQGPESGISRLHQLHADIVDNLVADPQGRSQHIELLRKEAAKLIDEKKKQFELDYKQKIHGQLLAGDYQDYTSKLGLENSERLQVEKELLQKIQRDYQSEESFSRLFERYLSVFDAVYLSSLAAEDKLRRILFLIHLEMLKEKGSREPLLLFDGARDLVHERQYEILAGLPGDAPGVFSKLAGIFWAYGIDIQGGNIQTSEGMIVDRFFGFSSKRVSSPESLNRLHRNILEDWTEILPQNGVSLHTIFEQLGKDYRSVLAVASADIPAEVVFLEDSEAEGVPVSAFRLIARDRPGFLHIVTGLLGEINLVQAPITTHPVLTDDIFYVNKNGRLLTESEKTALKEKLESVLNQPVIDAAVLFASNERPEIRVISKEGLPSEKDLQHGTGILYRLTREKHNGISRFFQRSGRKMLPEIQRVIVSLIQDKDKDDPERVAFLKTFSTQELQDLTLRPFLYYPDEAEDTKAVIGGGKPSAYLRIKNIQAFKKWTGRNRELLRKAGLGITRVVSGENIKSVFYYRYALVNQIYQEKIAANPVYEQILKALNLSGKQSLADTEIDWLMESALGIYFNEFSGVLLGYGTSDPLISEMAPLLGLTALADYFEIPRDVLQPFDTFLVYSADIVESFKSAGQMKKGLNTFNAAEKRAEIRQTVKRAVRSEIREAVPQNRNYSKIAMILLGDIQDETVILETAGFIREEIQKSGLAEVSERIYKEAETMIQARAAKEMESKLANQTQKIKVQQEKALAAIKWLTESLASADLGDGSVAIAFHAPGKEPILKQALEQVVGGNQIIALLSSETQAEGLNARIRKAGKISRLRPQLSWGPDMTVENDKLLPVIQIVPAGETNSNPNVLSVDSMSTAESDEYGAFTSVVDAVARIVFSVVIGKRVETISDLNKPGAFDRLLASLLKEEPGKIAALRQQYPNLNNLFRLEGNRLQINTAALDIITQYRADQAAKHAA